MGTTEATYEVIGGPLDGETREVGARTQCHVFPLGDGQLHAYVVRLCEKRDRAGRVLAARDCLVYGGQLSGDAG